MMAGGMGWDKQEAEEGYDDKATPTGKKKGFSPLFSRSAGSLAGPGPRTEAAGGWTGLLPVQISWRLLTSLYL